MNVAFVIGNGESRAPVDLSKIHHRGTVYGCNAVYRDFTPDHLIAVDDKMLKELDANSVADRMPVWTYLKKHRSDRPYRFFDHTLGWSSGPSALKLAVDHAADRVYILGFDYSGVDNTINNIYAGTQNYRSRGSVPTYYRNWLWQTRKVIADNPHVEFHRVIDEDCLPSNSFHDLLNIHHESVEDFTERTRNGQF